MKLSLIIACYNIEKYIERCINSVLPQITNEVELIVVNDGSKDNSLEIINTLHTENSNFTIFSIKNSGLSAVRNFGVGKASGEYIWFIDGDDYIESNAIQTLLNEIDTSHADMICFNHTVLERDGLHQFHEWNRASFDKMGLFKAKRFFAWSRIYKRELFNHRLFNEELRNIEDVEFNISLSPFINTIQTIPDYLYVYERTNVSSISMNRNKRHLVILNEHTFKVHKSLIDQMNFLKDPALKEQWEKELNMSYAAHIYSLYRFYNCKTLKHALNKYKDWGVYPFKYKGNFKMKCFTLIVNHRTLWSLHKFLKTF